MMSRRFSNIAIDEIDNDIIDDMGQKMSDRIIGWTNNTRKYPMLDDFIIPELSSTNENES